MTLLLVRLRTLADYTLERVRVLVGALLVMFAPAIILCAALPMLLVGVNPLPGWLAVPLGCAMVGTSVLLFQVVCVHLTQAELLRVAEKVMRGLGRAGTLAVMFGTGWVYNHLVSRLSEKPMFDYNGILPALELLVALAYGAALPVLVIRRALLPEGRSK